MSVDDVPVDVIAYVLMPYLIESELDPDNYDSDVEESSEYKMNIKKRDDIRALSRVNKKWRTAMRKCFQKTPEYITMYHLACIEDIVTMPNLWESYFKSSFESSLEREINVLRHVITFPFGEAKYEVLVSKGLGINICQVGDNHLRFTVTIHYFYNREMANADDVNTYVDVGHSIHNITIDLEGRPKRILGDLKCTRGQNGELPSQDEFKEMCACADGYILHELKKVLVEHSRVDDYVYA